MENNKSYRIRTNVNEDSIVNVNLQQDFDFLEILSLKLKQSNLYKLHTSNYGVIVGRVLANEAFGIPNAKLSIFVSLDDDNTLIEDIYPYLNVQDTNDNNIRYNLLKDSSSDECYNVVGTFPNKRLVLDDNTVLEVFEKYYKYTTVTNNSGDYMIPCVPIGNQTIHVDIDLSDIGVLSQRPRDMIYKGYNIEQFENASQFKKSTNLDSLAQLYSQNTSVYVYPLWGDSEEADIAITRSDIQIQYKFEPTCVFIGSLISDSPDSYVNHKCKSHKESGYMRHMVSGEGTIEMIRKTTEGTVEEHQVKGTNVINGNGVWCYQIPMNLDYVITDEFGNIVPTDNATIGVPTRSRVRFRVSLTNDDNPSDSKHTAKYLIPNNPNNLVENSVEPIYNGSLNVDYEFGSNTKEESFRDLFWNKVYTVKNYVPRFQSGKKAETRKYSSIRTVNYGETNNPVPYNNIRFRLSFTYRIICIISNIVTNLTCFLNSIIALVDWLIDMVRCPFKVLGWLPFGIGKAIKKICLFKQTGLKCVEIGEGISEEFDECENGKEVKFYPCCNEFGGVAADLVRRDCNCNPNFSPKRLNEYLNNGMAEDNEVVNLDFNNDWINGTLYMPSWFYRKKKKKRFLFWPKNVKIREDFCDCDKQYSNSIRYLLSFPLNNVLNVNGNNIQESSISNNVEESSLHTDKSIATGDGYGIIKKFMNMKGQYIYYYSPCFTIGDRFYRQYATDIVLLGSLNSCDLDGMPQAFVNIPSSTYNVPPYTAVEDGCNGAIEMSGMDWFGGGEREIESKNNQPRYGRGLFMDVGCSSLNSKPKTILNVQRMCELGVTNDARYDDSKASGGAAVPVQVYADGLITNRELIDYDSRSMFASLNHNNLKTKIDNKTGYPKYDLSYKYLNGFDGRLSTSVQSFANNFDNIKDNFSPDYIRFRFGPTAPNGRYYDGKRFPLYNNSLYFYFGIKDGLTAIDEFNKQFFSTCNSPESSAFTVAISDIIPNGWCTTTGNIGSFKINPKNISRPYSYTVKGSDGTVVTSGSDVVDNSVSINNLANDRYEITIIDNNGNQVITYAELEPTYINIVVSKIDLIVPSSSMSCNELISNNKQGQLIIEKIIKDNKEYTIQTLQNNNILLVNGDSSKYKLEITYRNSDNPTPISYLDNLPYNRTNIKVIDGKVYIPICSPNSFIITITEVCCTGACTNYELTSNYATKTLIVNEPLKMKVYINGIYADILTNWNTGWGSQIVGWDNILTTNSFDMLKFPEVTDVELWETLLQTEFPLDEDGNIDTIKRDFLIEKFKMKSLFELNTIFNVYSKEERAINVEIVDGTEPFVTVINCNQDNEDDFNKNNKRLFLKEEIHNISTNSIYNYPTLTYHNNKKQISIFDNNECTT